jgi:hypothetical protein
MEGAGGWAANDYMKGDGSTNGRGPRLQVEGSSNVPRVGWFRTRSLARDPCLLGSQNTGLARRDVRVASRSRQGSAVGLLKSARVKRPSGGRRPVRMGSG